MVYVLLLDGDPPVPRVPLIRSPQKLFPGSRTGFPRPPGPQAEGREFPIKDQNRVQREYFEAQVPLLHRVIGCLPRGMVPVVSSATDGCSHPLSFPRDAVNHGGPFHDHSRQIQWGSVDARHRHTTRGWTHFFAGILTPSRLLLVVSLRGERVTFFVPRQPIPHRPLDWAILRHVTTILLFRLSVDYCRDCRDYSAAVRSRSHRVSRGTTIPPPIAQQVMMFHRSVRQNLFT